MGLSFGEYLHVARSVVINSSTSRGVNPRIMNVGTNFARSRGLRNDESSQLYRRFQERDRSTSKKKKKQSCTYVNQPRKMNRSPSAFQPFGISVGTRPKNL